MSNSHAISLVRQYSQVRDHDDDDDEDHNDATDGSSQHTNGQRRQSYVPIKTDHDHDDDDSHSLADSCTEPTNNLTPRDVKEKLSGNLSDSAFSFDLDDDDELDDLQRYDFHRRDATPSTAPRPTMRGPDSSNYNNKFYLALYGLYDMFHHARMESRRKRAEQWLEASDSPFQQCWLCLCSYCDLTDHRGGLVFLAVLGIYILVLVLKRDVHLLLIGAPLLVFRLLLRPLYWIAWGRRLHRKRQATMALYDELNKGDISPEQHTRRQVLELSAGQEFPGDFPSLDQQQHHHEPPTSPRLQVV